MIKPGSAYLVTCGRYDGYSFLAVFPEQRGAQEFADHVNLTTERYVLDDAAWVEEIDFYGTGWQRPSAGREVLDGEVVDECPAINCPLPAASPPCRCCEPR